MATGDKFYMATGDNYYMPGPSEAGGPEDRPMRETAQTRLKHIIDGAETTLAGLRALDKALEKVEVGSPLEALLWALLCKVRDPL